MLVLLEARGDRVLRPLPLLPAALRALGGLLEAEDVPSFLLHRSNLCLHFHTVSSLVEYLCVQISPLPVLLD